MSRSSRARITVSIWSSLASAMASIPISISRVRQSVDRDERRVGLRVTEHRITPVGTEHDEDLFVFCHHHACLVRRARVDRRVRGEDRLEPAAARHLASTSPLSRSSRLRSRMPTVGGRVVAGARRPDSANTVSKLRSRPTFRTRRSSRRSWPPYVRASSRPRAGAAA